MENGDYCQDLEKPHAALAMTQWNRVGRTLSWQEIHKRAPATSAFKSRNAIVVKAIAITTELDVQATC